MRPRLTFACELDPDRLVRLFSDGSVAAELVALQARVALMLSDFSDERAGVVRSLNEAGVPVVGIPLLSLEEGYYFTPDNAARAAERYREWKDWTAREGLRWAGVGLDIEPSAQVYLQLMDDPWRLPAMLLPRLRDRDKPKRAAEAYASLVASIRRDGYAVENYQFPPLADERAAGSTLLQRLFGLVDVATDREVWMLYTSVFPFAIGPGLLWDYAPEAPVVAVGSTGGGPDIPGHPQVPALSWDELARDLRVARHWCDDLYIHSLEGCVERGYLHRLRDVDWSKPPSPPRSAPAIKALRLLLRAALRASAAWPPRWPTPSPPPSPATGAL